MPLSNRRARTSAVCRYSTMNRQPIHRTSTPIISCLILTGVLAVLMLTASACGKKAPPVAPRRAPLVAVKDLQAERHEDDVTLSWHHSPENRQARGYLVLRAETALDAEPCAGCPLVFQEVETLPLSRSQRNQRHLFTFSQGLPAGFRYSFRVRAFYASGVQGPDSNQVEIERPSIEAPQVENTDSQPSGSASGGNQ